MLFNFGDGVCFFTDASLTGYGWWCGSDLQAGRFDDGEMPMGLEVLDVQHDHWQNFSLQEFSSRDININLLELVPVLLVIKRICADCANCHLVCFTDNTQVRACINKGVSANSSSMCILHQNFGIWSEQIVGFLLCMCLEMRICVQTCCLE